MNLKNEMNRLYRDFDEIGEFLEKEDLTISNALSNIKKVYTKNNRKKKYNNSMKDTIKTNVQTALDRIEYFFDKL